MLYKINSAHNDLDQARANYGPWATYGPLGYIYKTALNTACLLQFSCIFLQNLVDSIRWHTTNFAKGEFILFAHI